MTKIKELESPFAAYETYKEALTQLSRGLRNLEKGSDIAPAIDIQSIHIVQSRHDAMWHIRVEGWMKNTLQQVRIL